MGTATACRAVLPDATATRAAQCRSALATPGIFRTDCESSELSELRGRVEAAYASRRKLDLASLTRSRHAAAGLVKLYLRELPKPLLSFELYPYFLAAGDGNGNVLIKLGQLADLLGKLPRSSFRSAALLLALLHDTSVLNPVLPAAELARLFAPLLLRPQAGTAPPEQRAQAEAALALMISNGNPDGALLTSAASSQSSSAAVDTLGRQMVRTAVGVGGEAGGGAPVTAPTRAPTTAPSRAPTTAPTRTEWYYIDDQQNYVGPVDSHGLRQLRQHKYVHNDTYVWAESLCGWQRLSSLAEFSDAPPPPPPPPPPPVRPALPPMPPPGAAPAAPASSSAGAPLDANRFWPGSNAACASSGALAFSGRPPAMGGVAAPPSLGLAEQRKRPETHPSSGAAPLHLASTAMSAMSADGSSGSKPAPPALLPVTCGAVAGAPFTPHQAASLNAAPNAVPDALTPTLSRRPEPKLGHEPKLGQIPEPLMRLIISGEPDWADAAGLRLLAFGAGVDSVRCIIKEDGEVTDGLATTLAYIEANGEVGDAAMTYVGKAILGAGQVVDAADQLVGEFDSGRGYVKDEQGSVIAEIGKDGSLTNHSGQGVGRIEGFTFRHMPILAAYFLLVDPTFLRASVHGYGARSPH